MSSAIQRFTNVRREEVPALIASALFFFCVLSALMVIRPARESLGLQSGIEAVRWLFVGTAVVTLAVNPAFGFLVAKFKRIHFIAATYLFFAASLVGFWALLTMAPAATGEISGQVFYIWFSVFNLFSTMVFWALMVDRFTLEQSKRLFGVVAVGGTMGAMFGPWLAWTFVETIGTSTLILIAVGFLCLAVVFATIVARLQPESLAEAEAQDPDAPSRPPPVVREDEIIGGSSWEGFRAVARSRYLLGICGFVLIMAIMATFVYFTRLQMVEQMTDVMDEQTGLFAQIDFWTQFTTFLLQLLITGHIMKRLGVAFALALLPLTVALGFVGLAITGTFTALVILEAAYRAVQRGITRPARETLFTVIGREDKYKGKSVVDTFVYRTGDVVGAWSEGALGALGGGLVTLTSAVVPLAAAWAGLGIWLGREQNRQAPSPETAGAEPREPAGAPPG